MCQGEDSDSALEQADNKERCSAFLSNAIEPVILGAREQQDSLQAIPCLPQGV